VIHVHRITFYWQLPLQLQIGFVALTAVASYTGNALIGQQGIDDLTYWFIKLGFLLVPAAIGNCIASRSQRVIITTYTLPLLLAPLIFDTTGDLHSFV
jgi:hypothetical protein